ncbi:MAG: hypothetical protein CL823_05655 [Crocinitomicaceae bacterium]|nr:hypothetical protein [Crocinitomicaceae bacterium]
MKKFLLILISVLIVASGIYFIWSQNNKHSVFNGDTGNNIDSVPSTQSTTKIAFDYINGSSEFSKEVYDSVFSSVITSSLDNQVVNANMALIHRHAIDLIKSEYVKYLKNKSDFEIYQYAIDIKKESIAYNPNLDVSSLKKIINHYEKCKWVKNNKIEKDYNSLIKLDFHSNDCQKKLDEFNSSKRFIKNGVFNVSLMRNDINGILDIYQQKIDKFQDRANEYETIYKQYYQNGIRLKMKAKKKNFPINYLKRSRYLEYDYYLMLGDSNLVYNQDWNPNNPD